MSLLIATATNDDEFFLPQMRSMALLQRIRDWYMVIKTDKIAIDEESDAEKESHDYKHVHIQIARLLRFIMPAIQELSGAHWNFVLECIHEWLQVI